MENTECKVCTGITVENGKCRNCGAVDATTAAKAVSVKVEEVK